MRACARCGYIYSADVVTSPTCPKCGWAAGHPHPVVERIVYGAASAFLTEFAKLVRNAKGSSTRSEASE